MVEMMKAAVLAGPRRIECREVPVREPGRGEIVIRVSACGVCGSDVHMWKAGKGWGKGEMADFTMGHEFCGVVTEPNGSRFQKGDRVVFWANLYCGECDMCRAGQEHLCRDVDGTNYIGFVTNGAYAERFTGKAKNAYLLPEGVSDVAAACIDPLMVAYHAVRKSGLRLGEKVLVVGTGIIGLMMGELAKKSGASFVALAKRSDRKLAPAKKAGWFDAYLDSAAADAPEAAREMSGGGFDVIFEAVGSPETVDLCLRAARPGGRVVMVGNSVTETIPVDINRAVLREIQLLGSVSCTREEFSQTIGIIDSGLIDPTAYVTDVLPLEGLSTAFEQLTSSTDPILKAVVRP